MFDVSDSRCGLGRDGIVVFVGYFVGFGIVEVDEMFLHSAGQKFLESLVYELAVFRVTP